MLFQGSRWAEYLEKFLLVVWRIGRLLSYHLGINFVFKQTLESSAKLATFPFTFQWAMDAALLKFSLVFHYRSARFDFQSTSDHALVEECNDN